MNYFVAKRCFDYGLSLIGLLVFIPLMWLIAFLVIIQDGRPIFYVKKALGIYGKVFKTFKFRSMKNESLYITKLGKMLRETAMDELPQLLTIAKGEMSFVGPRPYGVEKYGISRDSTGEKVLPHTLIPERVAFAKRLGATPGLTGLAQLYAPKHASDEEVLRLDLKYITNKNFILDLYIILVSFWITLKRGWEKPTRKI
ncbi:MAG: sugar transferase [Candidatus Omnitrophota bacterium]|nr:sugar transferase [Candidatus Omnitrophota bacterium]